MNDDLSSLLSSTFIGGAANSDAAMALTIDSSGNIFVAGNTRSYNFPTTLGAYDTSYNGNGDAFVLKLNNNLSSLLASTVLGSGLCSEGANAISLDSSGNVFIAGSCSPAGLCPVAGGPGYYKFGGQVDVFIAKFNNSLSTLSYSTVIGGSYDDWAYAIALDSSENVFITGWSRSSNYPTTLDAYDRTNSGLEFFVSKLSSNFSSLLSSTFINMSSGFYQDNALAIDSSGNVFVTSDYYISKFDSNLSNRLASILVGGLYVRAIAIDSRDNVFVAGGNSSGVFVTKLDNNLSTRISSIGMGKTYDDGHALAIDSLGNVFVAGQAKSTDYPTTSGAYDVSHNGSTDVFVTKLDNNLLHDNDNDGYWSDVDCNDNNPAIHPVATEVCDYVDNNCDGQIDEGVLNTYYRDADWDFYGDAAMPTQACSPVYGYVENNIDCDDSDPAINPGATEILRNGIDDDCNPATPVATASGNGYNTPLAGFRASLALNVTGNSTSGSGTLKFYYTRTRVACNSSSISSVVASGNTATVMGTCTNGDTFTATVSDAPEQMGITIYKPDATLRHTQSPATVTGNYTVSGGL